MKKIRIKVKTLLMITLVFAITLAGIIGFSDKILYGIGVAYEKQENNDMASAYYKRIADKYPQRDSAIVAANRQIENLLENYNMDYFSDRVNLQGGSSVKSGTNISLKSLKNINEDYDAILKHHDKGDKVGRYTIGVSLMNWFAGDYHKATKLLEGLYYLEDEDLKNVRDINLASMYMNSGNIKKGIDILKPLAEVEDVYKFIRRDILAYGYFTMKDRETAKGYVVNNKVIKYPINKKLNDPYIKVVEGLEHILWHYENITNTMGESKNVLKGRVTTNGEPLPYAIVYMKDKSNRGTSTGISDVTGSWGITDEEGYFHIEGFSNGEYRIAISVDWQRVQGKILQMNKEYNLSFSGNTEIIENIEFKDPVKITSVEISEDNVISIGWANYQDAEYYTIRMGEITGENTTGEQATFSYSSDKMKIEGNKITLDVDKEREILVAGRGMAWGMAGIEPYYVLDPLYHEGNYAFVITIYDKDDNILGDSMGIFSNRPYDTVYIRGKEWTEADKLLIERRYDEAIEEYERMVDENPKDMRTAQILAKLYYYGWEWDDERKGYFMKGRDVKKATYYFEVLHEAYEDSSYVKEMLAELYTLDGSYTKALELYNDISTENKKYLYSSIGSIYAYMGQWDKAIENYLEYTDLTGYDSAISKVIMIYLAQNKLDEAMAVAEKFKGDSFQADFTFILGRYINEVDRDEYSQFYEYMRNGDLVKADRFLETKKDSLGRLYRGIRILQSNLDRDQREEEYTRLYKQVSIQPHKALMTYFGKGSLNSGFGDR